MCRELLCRALQHKNVSCLESECRKDKFSKYSFFLNYFSIIFLIEKMLISIHDRDRTTLKWSDANRTNSRSDRSQDLICLSFQNSNNWMELNWKTKLKYAFPKEPIENVSHVSYEMCRGLAGENVSQWAPRVVQCVANYDTCDTF